MSTDVAPTPTTANGICMALGQVWTVDNTTGDSGAIWTRIDDPSVASLSIDGDSVFSPSHVVASWTTDRGRQYELDTTQTGTATIQIIDTSGLFDPTGTSPYSASISSMTRCVINVQNPVTGDYSDVFSGYVSTYTWSWADQSKSVMLVEIDLVDGFDPLNRSELIPDQTGYTTFRGELTDDRINNILASSQWPSALTSINSGNTSCIGYQYNSGTTSLSAIQDAADAEFPGVANFYMDRHGNATFRGRWPRFTPEDYTNQVTFWNCGDYDYAETFGYAPISDMQFMIDDTLLYNVALCYPYNFPQYGYQNQLDYNGSSITQYGIRQITLNDLLCNGAQEDTTHGFSATTGPQECLYYADYYVDNFCYPSIRVSSITFKTVDPNGGTPNEALWDMLCNIEIGDVLSVYTTDPGGGGLNPSTSIVVPTVDGPGPWYIGNQFYVDGIHHQVNPLNDGYPDWTMTLDLSPRSWYTTFKGQVYYSAP